MIRPCFRSNAARTCALSSGLTGEVGCVAGDARVRPDGVAPREQAAREARSPLRRSERAACGGRDQFAARTGLGSDDEYRRRQSLSHTPVIVTAVGILSAGAELGVEFA
jgi:hypothetical protein